VKTTENNTPLVTGGADPFVHSFNRLNSDLSRIFFNAMSEGAIVYKIIFDTNGKPVDAKVIDVNPAFTVLTGITAEYALNKLVTELFHYDFSRYMPQFRSAFAKKEAVVFETFFEPLGKILKISMFQAGDDSFVTLFTNITETISTHFALEESKDLNQKIIEHMPIAVILHKNGLCVKVNPAASKLLHAIAPDKLIGMPIMSLIHPDSQELAAQQIQNIIEEKSLTESREETFICIDGTIRVGLAQSMLVRYRGDPVILTMVVDITDYKHTEAELRESNEHCLILSENIADAIWVLDLQEMRFRYVSPSVEKLRGYTADEVMAQDIHAAITPLSLVAFQRALPARIAQFERGSTIAYIDEIEQPCRDGSTVVTETTTRFVRNPANGHIEVFGVSRDISERKQAQAKHEELERHLQQLQKLQSLGLLAGSIAHDFNNVLGGIMGYIEIARLQCNKDEKLFPLLGKAAEQVKRAKGLTKQLITFASGEKPIRQTGSVGTLLIETAQFSLSGSSVTCTFDVADDVWACDFDRGQMGQALDNIFINARQAMPNGGILTISAKNLVVANDNKGVPSKRGNYVAISIADSGVGIPPDVILHIFDPFFTTKENSTGLGLAMAYSIISKHDGAITVDSIVGKGSVFTLFLPATKEKTAPIVSETALTRKGSGRILIMDDEKSIREVIGAMLKLMGYTVDYAADGAAALSLINHAAETGKAYIAAIMDLTIPGGMGGKDAVKELRKTEPLLPVFVTSGYSSDPIMTDPGAYGFNDKIPKPFSFEELGELLSRNEIGGK